MTPHTYQSTSDQFDQKYTHPHRRDFTEILMGQPKTRIQQLHARQAHKWWKPRKRTLIIGRDDNEDYLISAPQE